MSLIVIAKRFNKVNPVMAKNIRRIKVPTSELRVQLKDQIGFLISSCNLFDQGKKQEAKRIAAHLRILFHDTRMSKSLLSQLGLESIRYLNTAEPYDPANLVSHVGLVSFKFDCPSGRRAWIVPRGNPEKLPAKAMLPFPKWWNMIVIVAKGNKKDIAFSRRELVLHVANTDGGSHVDDTLDEKYMALSRWNAVGIATIQDGIEKPIDNPVFACIRQIAHEVLSTLQNEHPASFERPYSYKRSDVPSSDNPVTGRPTVCSLVFKTIN